MTDFGMAISILLSVIVSSLCLIYLFLRGLRVRNVTAPPRNGDLANMMILLQTMRDIVTQQKDLARQFNESLDRKVTLVRDLVDSAREERAELRRMQQEVALALTAARDDLAAWRQGLAAPPPVSPERGNRPPARTASMGQPHTLAPAPLPMGGTPELIEEYSDDLIDTWTGFDFGGDEPALGHAPGEPEPQETPEAQHASRQAFRDLLNIEDSARHDTASAIPTPVPYTNGRGHAVPLQRRVYEYNDAGMNVGDIARELGIGKGEVRLILSLRKDKERA